MVLISRFSRSQGKEGNEAGRTQDQCYCSWVGPAGVDLLAEPQQRGVRGGGSGFRDEVVVVGVGLGVCEKGVISESYTLFTSPCKVQVQVTSRSTLVIHLGKEVSGNCYLAKALRERERQRDAVMTQQSRGSPYLLV